MLAPTRQLIASAAILAYSLGTFRHAQAQTPTEAKAGRIYVATIYRLKPDGGEEDKTFHSLAIVAIDPATGDWHVIAEKDASTGKGGGNDARLSPDRRNLVFWHPGDGIWKCEADGQFPFKIFDHRKNSEIRTVWSADSKHLVVAKGEYIKKDSKDVWQSETWQIDADGRNPVRLTIPETDMVNDWSPDGQWFVTCASRESQNGQLYLIKNDGSQERKLTQDGLNVDASFSPDGKTILYNHRTRDGSQSVWTVDFDGGKATELLNEEGITAPDGAFWSPDGKQIAVVLFDYKFMGGRKVRGGPLETAERRIDIMDADRTNRRQIPLRGAKFRFISSRGDWR